MFYRLAHEGKDKKTFNVIRRHQLIEILKCTCPALLRENLCPRGALCKKKFTERKRKIEFHPSHKGKKVQQYFVLIKKTIRVNVTSTKQCSFYFLCHPFGIYLIVDRFLQYLQPFKLPKRMKFL